MTLDIRGCTRATMKASTRVLAPPERVGETAEPPSCQGSGLAILARERGIPSKRKSPARVDQVPALCTHRPLLLPIGGFREELGPLPGYAPWVRCLLARGAESLGMARPTRTLLMKFWC